MIDKEKYEEAKNIVNQYEAENKWKEEMLSVDYLIQKHPELTEQKAQMLLDFCIQNTIEHKTCYGSGSIMYPMWKASLVHQAN